MTKRQNLHEWPEPARELFACARRHGLSVDPDRMEIESSGMDFLVAFAEDEKGQAWVLRKPRRDDVWERAENESKVLRFVSRFLPVGVPEWRVCAPDLIAYPLLGGHPVATVDPSAGGYRWRFPQHSLSDEFYESLAGALAALHAADPEEAVRAGVRYKSPNEARDAFAANIEEIRHSFAVPKKLSERWAAWLGTDSYWPEHSALHHGDLHPPHILVDAKQRVTGLIDWTEAEIADPGKDFVILYALFGREGLQDLLRRYERAGGRTWPRMREHIAEQWAAYPALVAKFALITGKEADREMANGMLANGDVE